ncbi:MAG: hypothetical protein ACI9ZX_002193, partial [Algoriphagus sp.]
MKLAVYYKIINKVFMRKSIPKLIQRSALVLGMFGILLYSEGAFAQKKNKKDSKNAPAAVAPVKPPAKTTGPKPYKEVITKNAKSKDGLFKVHEIEGKFYYEIPDSLLG